jgi:NAD+--asparagine ADP-ribosyltransferase
VGDALLEHAVLKAKALAGIPGAAKRSAAGDRALAAAAAAAEWNRKQALRTGIRDLIVEERP